MRKVLISVLASLASYNVRRVSSPSKVEGAGGSMPNFITTYKKSGYRTTKYINRSIAQKTKFDFIIFLLESKVMLPA